MKDYYIILGVPRTATKDEIKKAFRVLAHRWHPDKQGGDEAKFKEINEAYTELMKRPQQFGGDPRPFSSTSGTYTTNANTRSYVYYEWKQQQAQTDEQIRRQQQAMKDIFDQFAQQNVKWRKNWDDKMKDFWEGNWDGTST